MSTAFLLAGLHFSIYFSSTTGGTTFNKELLEKFYPFSLESAVQGKAEGRRIRLKMVSAKQKQNEIRSASFGQ